MGIDHNGCLVHGKNLFSLLEGIHPHCPDIFNLTGPMVDRLAERDVPPDAGRMLHFKSQHLKATFYQLIDDSAGQIASAPNQDSHGSTTFPAAAIVSTISYILETPPMTSFSFRP